MATFKDRLKHLRTLAGYSQQDFADIMNVTKKDRPEPYYLQGFERFSFIYAVP